MPGAGLDASGRVAPAGADEFYAFFRARQAFLRSALDLKIPLGLLVRRPAQLVRIANKVNPTLPRTFPWKGSTGTIVAVDNTAPGITVDLDTSIPTTEDYTGLLFMPTGGAAVGRGAIIASYTSATRRCTFPDAQAWPGGAVPAAGDPYEILVPGLLGGVLLVKGELNDTSGVLDAQLLHHTYPLVGETDTYVKPTVLKERVQLANLNDTDATVESGYSHLAFVFRETWGGAGCQVRVTVNLAADPFSLWGCVV